VITWDEYPPRRAAEDPRVVTVVAILAFWISLLAHFQDVEKTSGQHS